jgi:hypothetical protein
MRLAVIALFVLAAFSLVAALGGGGVFGGGGGQLPNLPVVVVVRASAGPDVTTTVGEKFTVDASASTGSSLQYKYTFYKPTQSLTFLGGTGVGTGLGTGTGMGLGTGLGGITVPALTVVKEFDWSSNNKQDFTYYDAGTATVKVQVKSGTTTSEDTLTATVNDVKRCGEGEYLDADGNCVAKTTDADVAGYASKADFQALTKQCYYDSGGGVQAMTPALGWPDYGALYMTALDSGGLIIDYGNYGPTPLTMVSYCDVSDKVDMGERSEVTAFSWTSTDYSNSNIAFTLNIYDSGNNLLSSKAVSSKGSVGGLSLKKGRYAEWVARFNPSSNPHSSTLGGVWVEHKPAPVTITPVIGLKVKSGDEIVWYAKDSVSPGHNIKTYSWDFDGDAVADSDKGIDRWLYSSDADVLLTVSDDTPASDSTTIPVEVV